MKKRILFLQVFNILTIVWSFNTANALEKGMAGNSSSPLYSRQKIKFQSEDRNGTYIEAVYANVTSQSKRYEVTQSERANDFTNANPERPLNGVGFGVGYRRIKARSFGFDVGGQVMQESNQLGGTYAAFYQVLANLNYSMAPQFYGYLGPNVTYVDSKDEGAKNSTAGFGGQIGGGYLFKGFSIKLGYQYIQYQLQFDYLNNLGETRSFKTDGAGSGFIAQIGYVF